MTEAQAVPLERAERIAEGLRDKIAPSCERIEIAGSIRRRRPVVGDIELCLVSKIVPMQREGQMALGADPAANMVDIPQAWVTLDELDHFDDYDLWAIKPGQQEIERWPLKADGRYWRLWLPEEEIKVDVFVCTPETWGLNYLIRTGPAEFSQSVLARWKRVEQHGPEQKGSVEGRLRNRFGAIVDTPEERDVFDRCGLAYIEPERRGLVDLVGSRPARAAVR